MADQDTWRAVDDWIVTRLIGPDAALEEALGDSSAAGLPPIAVSPAQGKMLQLFARMVGAGRILEIGTLGGYSTIWLARALPPGDGVGLVTLELEPRHAEVARANLDRARVGQRVEIRVGPALETLQTMVGEGLDPFDLVFIDADKESIPAYFDLCERITRPGGAIVVDNVVRGGQLADPSTDDPRVAGVRAFHEALAGRPGVEATTVQTVGAKGYDGFTLVILDR